MKKVLFAGALGMICLALVSGTAQTGGKKESTKGQLPPGWKQLDLSKEQILNIYAIHGKFKAKVKALEDQLKTIRMEERQEMFKVLTDDQKALARKLLAGEDTTPAKKEEKKKDS